MKDELAFKLHSTTDAWVWAQEFCARFNLFTEDGVVQDPHGLMVGWFANAIETGRAAGILAPTEEKMPDHLYACTADLDCDDDAIAWAQIDGRWEQVCVAHVPAPTPGEDDQ